MQVSRTYTFGRVGTHMGEGFDHHLGVMKLNDDPVDWKAMDLDFLLQSNYTDLFIHWMDKGEVGAGFRGERTRGEGGRVGAWGCCSFIGWTQERWVPGSRRESLSKNELGRWGL